MSRLPWFPFYPSDWHRDTRCLTFHAKGCWADLIGILWDSKTRGVKTFDLDGWALELGKPREEISTAFMELEKRQIANFETHGNGDVTVSCRRQVREEKERESTRLRVKRFRSTVGNGTSNAPVTRESQNQKSESEVRSQKKKKSATHPMPEEWSLTDAMKDYGLKHGMTTPTLQHEFQHCKTRQAEKRFTKRGWESQVWQTWVMNWVSFGSRQVTTLTAPPNAKCAYANEPCEKYAVPGSKYCAEHKQVIVAAQLRKTAVKTMAEESPHGSA